MKNPFKTFQAEWRNWPTQVFCETVTLIMLGLVAGAIVWRFL